MTALTGKASVKMGMNKGKLMTDSRFYKSQNENENQFQDCCQGSAWARSRSAS